MEPLSKPAWELTAPSLVYLDMTVEAFDVAVVYCDFHGRPVVVQARKPGSNISVPWERLHAITHA